MWIRLASALGLSVVSALAVDFSFGAAFVDNRVGYLVAAYVGALTGLLFGRDGLAVAGHPGLRALMGVIVAIGTLGCLRSWAYLALPFGEFATTGHSPYFALPAVALLATGALLVIGAVASRGRSSTESGAVLEG